jgi:hypothetical protein
LPVRRSKAHLVPGAFQSAPPPTEPPHRSAEEVRDRLRGFHSGLRKARETG